MRQVQVEIACSLRMGVTFLLVLSNKCLVRYANEFRLVRIVTDEELYILPEAWTVGNRCN